MWEEHNVTLRDFLGWTPKTELEAQRGWTDRERAFYIASAVVRSERTAQENKARQELINKRNREARSKRR